MSITIVGSATAGATSITLPTHQAGDLIVLFAYRDGNDAVPDQPTGQNWTDFFSTAGANTNSHRLAWKVARDNAEASGTWTNASMLIAVVLRSSQATALSLGAGAAGTGSSSTLSFTGLTLTRTDQTSRLLGFVGHRSTNVTIETPPAGMTNVTFLGNATCEAAVHTLDGAVGWATTTVSVGGTSSGYRTHVLEVVEAPYTGPTAAQTLTLTPVARTLRPLAPLT